MMNTFEVKSTPIETVWELGKLDRDPTWSISNSQPIDELIEEFVDCLGIEIYFAFPVDNPQEVALLHKRLQWHVDYCKYNYNKPHDLTFPSNKTLDAIMCVSGQTGTWFQSRKTGRVWQSDAWTIYYMTYNTIHASPLVKEDRHLTRFYIERGLLKSYLKANG